MCVFIVYQLLQIVQLPPMKTVLESIHLAGVNYSVFDEVSIEPTDTRYWEHTSTVLYLLNTV